MDDDGSRAAFGRHRSSHRRRSRVGLRPRLARRRAEPRARRGAGPRLGRRRHEDGLERGPRVRKAASMKEWLIQATEVSIVVIDAIAFLVIIVGTVDVVFRALRAVLAGASR